MDLLTLMLLSTALVPVSSSPISLGPPAFPTQRAPAAGADLPAGDTIVLNPLPSVSAGLSALPTPGCTTTLTEMSFNNPCFWDGTTTTYPYTTVSYLTIDCNGCDNVFVEKGLYFCPNQRINGTLQAATPSTSWSPVCKPSATLAGQTAEQAAPPATTTDSNVATPQTAAPVASPANSAPTPRAEPAVLKDARSPEDGLQAAACPTTLIVQPGKSAGKTSTRYSTFTTTTVTLDCAGCPLVISTALAGYGPPGTFETTTTLPVGAVTTYACR